MAEKSGLGTAGAFGLSPVSVLFVLFMYFIEILVAFLQLIFLHF